MMPASPPVYDKNRDTSTDIYKTSVAWFMSEYKLLILPMEGDTSLRGLTQLIFPKFPESDLLKMQMDPKYERQE